MNRISEAVAVLSFVFLLIAAKSMPFLAVVPLTQVAGIICFGYAIVVAMRLYRFELERIRSL